MILCAGDTVFWSDPDNGGPGKWVEILSINDFTVTVIFEGATFEVLPGDLDYFPEEDEDNV